MDLLQRFLQEIGLCFGRKALMGDPHAAQILSPHLVVSKISLRKEGMLFLVSGTLQSIMPYENPLRNPTGKGENPPGELGLFLRSSEDFAGSFAGEEKLEVFSKNGGVYLSLSIDFHSYPLRDSSLFTISAVLPDNPIV